jgi:hypothetical protein
MIKWAGHTAHLEKTKTHTKFLPENLKGGIWRPRRRWKNNKI